MADNFGKKVKIHVPKWIEDFIGMLLHKNKLMDDITSSMVIFSLHILEITDKLTIIEEQITLVKRFYNEHVRMGAQWNIGAKNMF